MSVYLSIYVCLCVCMGCSLAYTVDGQHLFCATSDCVIHVWTKSTAAGRRKHFNFVSYV